MTVDSDALRIHVYDVTLSTGRAPLVREMAASFGCSDSEIAAALGDLVSRRVLILQPEGEILMVPPFSAVPTAFVVSTGSFAAYANCGWDALGAAVMLQRPTVISASCADCGHAFRLESDGRSVGGDLPILHFALPVRRWWESIVFT